MSKLGSFYKAGKYENKIVGSKLSLAMLLKKKRFLAGFIIFVVYSIIAIMDVAVPEYLGAGYGLITQLTVFIRGTSTVPLPPTLKPSVLYGSGPVWWYYLGTTYDGIPILPAILSSMYIDMGYTGLIVFLSSMTGLLIGTFSGYFGGIVDEVLMRFMDAFISLPYYVTAIGISLLFSISLQINNIPFDGLDVLSIALIISLFPVYARISRSAAMNIRKTRYIDAAITGGSNHIKNLFQHVMPNVLSPLIIQITLNVGSVILFLSFIEYLNLQDVFGLSKFLPDLGNLIAQGSLMVQPVPGGLSNWWTTALPVLFLVIIVVGVNIMGDGLRDALDIGRRDV